jgi:hypothetical protein
MNADLRSVQHVNSLLGPVVKTPLRHTFQRTHWHGPKQINKIRIKLAGAQEHQRR